MNNQQLVQIHSILILLSELECNWSVTGPIFNLPHNVANHLKNDDIIQTTGFFNFSQEHIEQFCYLLLFDSLSMGLCGEISIFLTGQTTD